MCVSKPKAPKVQPIPDRMAAVLPDRGDPGVRAANRRRRRLSPAAMIFSKWGILGAPKTGAPGTGAGAGSPGTGG